MQAVPTQKCDRFARKLGKHLDSISALFQTSRCDALVWMERLEIRLQECVWLGLCEKRLEKRWTCCHEGFSDIRSEVKSYWVSSRPRTTFSRKTLHLNHMLDRFLWQTYFDHAVTTGGKRRQHCTSVSQSFGHSVAAEALVRDWWRGQRYRSTTGLGAWDPKGRGTVSISMGALCHFQLQTVQVVVIVVYCSHSYQKDTKRIWKAGNVRSLLSGELCLHLHCTLNIIKHYEF